VLPIPAELLARLRSLSNDGWIFQARNGAPLDPKNAIIRHVKPAAKKAGVESLNWHSFRHSFAAAQRRSGTHPKVLSAMLGHSRVQLAMDVYDHVNVDELRAPLEKLLRSCCEIGSVQDIALIQNGLVGPPGFEPGTNGL
jgi:integrase